MDKFIRYSNNLVYHTILYHVAQSLSPIWLIVLQQLGPTYLGRIPKFQLKQSSRSRVMANTSEGGGSQPYFAFFTLQHFSVNFHFLKNGQSYDGDFFPIYTINHGLSFDGIKSARVLNFDWLVLHTIFRIRLHSVPWHLVESMQLMSLELVSFERAHQTASNDVFRIL